MGNPAVIGHFSSQRANNLRHVDTHDVTAMYNSESAFLPGLTWVFAILAVADARIPFQYLFCIFNSIQGFLIFIFHVIRERSVRESWWSCCCSGDAPQRKFSSAVSESQGTKTTGLTSVHKPSVQYDNVKLYLKNKI